MLVRTWLQGPRHGIVVRDMSRTIVPRQNRQEEFPGAAIFPRVSVWFAVRVRNIPDRGDLRPGPCGWRHVEGVCHESLRGRDGA